MAYAFSENYVLPLSHDEVSRGKGSLLGKMPGDEWEKRAGLRLLLGYMYAQPGKKLLFMGGEFGQWQEWDHDQSLDWRVMDSPGNLGIQRWLKDLNEAHRRESALHVLDFRPEGFQCVDASDCEQSVMSFLRKGRSEHDRILAVCNFTPVPRQDYRIGVPFSGFWREILNSDASMYGGSGRGNMGGVQASPVPFHGQGQSVSLTLPPLSILFLKLQ
jgi:1,4-alpha-glucan branching enzyme